MNRISTFLALVCLMVTGAWAQATAETQAAAAKEVISDFMGENAGLTVNVTIDPNFKDNGKDKFTYTLSGSTLTIKASNGVSACRGFYDFTKSNGAGICSWSANRFKAPTSPTTTTKTVTSPYRDHQYLNVVTYGYSMPYWDENRWDKEIAWMALHGIDMPLMLVGSETIYRDVFKALYGTSNTELDAWEVGPAHLPWMRMGNLAGNSFDGPLGDHWHSKQKALAKHILQKMGALGMKPVVPAFGGFVPPAVAQQLGNASTTGWDWIPGNYKNYRLTPTAGTGGQDGEFKKIGKKFIELWDQEYESSYGSQFKYYLSDSFNEMAVPSDPATLQTYGEQIYGAIKEGSGNNDAVWVTQGWEFVYGSGKWTNGSTSDAKYKALTAGVPQGKFMSLYMSPEYGNGKWSSYDNFDGDDWVYTMLPNMGGKNFWTGPLQNYATTWPKSMANSGAYSNCTGWGMTMEGIEYNEMLYELIADMGWTDPSTGKNLDNWVTEYGNARYGSDKYSDKFKALHTTMRNTVYSSYIDHVNFGWQGNGKSGGYYNAGNIGTVNDTFFEGFEAFFGDENMGELQAIAESGGLDETMRADLIEFSAFYAAARVEKICKRITTANNTGNKTLANELIAELDKVMTDMDYILTGHPIYDEAKWEAKARTLAGSDVDTQKKYVKNARRIVTTWYGNHQGHEAVNDYASRIYAGIIRDYYLPRLKAELNQLVNGTACNLRDIERSFTPNGDVATDAPELSDPGYYLGSDEKTTVPGGITSSTSDAVLLANIQALVEEAQEAGQIIIEKNELKVSTDAETHWYFVNSNNPAYTDRSLTETDVNGAKSTVKAQITEATNEQIWRFVDNHDGTVRMENRNGQSLTWESNAAKTYLANINAGMTYELDEANLRYALIPEGIGNNKALHLNNSNGVPEAYGYKDAGTTNYYAGSTWTLSNADSYIGVPSDDDFARITRRFQGFQTSVWGIGSYGSVGQPKSAAALQNAINAVSTRDLALATYTDYLATYDAALKTNFTLPADAEALKLFELIISAFQIDPSVNCNTEDQATFKAALQAAQTTLAGNATGSAATAAATTLETAVLSFINNATSFPYTSKAPVNGQFDANSKVVTMKVKKSGYITTDAVDSQQAFTLGNSTAPTTTAGYWIVSGNDASGYTFYNVGAGATKVLGMTGSEAGARAKLYDANSTSGVTTKFFYKKNQNGESVFYISGNNAWNDRGSYLALWNDGNVFGNDPGSAIIFAEVENEIPQPAEGDWTSESWTACSTAQNTNFKASAYYDVKQIVIGSAANARRQVRAKAAGQGSNTVTVTVKFSSGTHAQALYGVQLLNEDGTVAAETTYEFFSLGTSATKTYTLSNVPDGSYTVRVWGAATKGNETMTANGTVEVAVNGTKDGNTQNWNKNNWNIENTAVPAGVKALAPNVGITLNTGGAAQTYYYLDKQMTFDKATTLTTTITNEDNTTDLDLIGVELLQNGTLVTTEGTYDGHYSDGETNNTYTVQVPSAGDYTVRTWASYVPAKVPANGGAIYGGGEEEEILLRPTFVSSSDTRTTNGEYASKLVDDIDNPTSTKWGMGYTAGTPAWIVVQANNTVLKGYDLYNANDTNGQPNRRWKNWTVEGSNDNSNWTTIATVTDANMNTTNYGKNSFSTESNAQQYNYYKFTITANEGADMIQMSDLQLKVVYKGEKISYLVTSDGVPSGVTVKIKGATITPAESWTAGATYKAIAQLSTSDITAENLGDGYVFEARVDNNNHQVWLYFKQLFAPISNISEKETATSYYLKNAAGYYPYVDNGNIKATQDRKSSSKYIFIKAATVGQYYIYDISANKYVYANSTGNGGNQTSQSSSKVQMTTDLSTAKPWTFTYDGRIVPAAGGGSGLNFTGGPSYVLNLYATTDGNSEWTIIDSSIGSLACAVTMFSEPGKEYIHKLIPESGVTVESITLNGDLASSDLTLKTDRVNKGNNYKYVYGHAPTAEGTYTYDVNLSDGTKATVKLTVSSFLQSPTPGMVWVSWNWFKNTINATNLTEIADGLKSKGLYNVGFKTIVIDDAWGTGSSNATLTYNSEKFPNGMASFVSGINAKGIKVGIYSDAANSTCGNFQPGSLGVETEHVQMFDSWGIDFLKYDFCGGSNAQKSYTTMGDAIAALNATRKGTNPDPFVFNACEWGRNKPWQWGAEAGTSMWRATSDAREDWIGTHDFPGVLGGSDEVRDLWMYAGVNRFNDLDMMTIGLHGKGSPSNHTASHPSDGGTIQGLTDDQARSQMSIWSMLASPLSLSCDVRETPSNPCNSGAGVTPLTATDLATLKNADILTISQDPLGQQAEYMPSLGSNSEDFSTSGCDVYVKDLAGGDKALAIVNRSASATMEAKTINLDNIYLNAGTTYYVKNVWTGTVTQCTGSITTDTFKASETKVYIISENELEDTSEDTPDEPEDSYITVSTSTGSMNSGWTNKWTHSSAPAITISCSPANINSSNGNLDIRNGSGSNNCNFTITAPEGYHITGYSATVTGSGYTVTPAGGSAITVTNDGVALNVTGLDAQTATFKATGNNSQCVYSNFKVYYKAVEPTEPTDPTYPFIVSPSTSDLHWHYLQVNGNKYVAYDSTTGRFNNSTNAPTGENGLFAFVQVEGGFKIVNKAAGIDKAISEPIGTNIVNETLVGVVDYNQAKTYIYQNNSGHDVFGIASNDQAHLNDIGGKLGYWVSAASGTGDGSTFKFIPAEVMISTPEVKHYYTIRNNNNPSDYAHYDADNQYLSLGTALDNSAVFYFTSAGSNANGSQLVNIHNYEAGDSKTMNDWNSWGTSSPRTWYIKLADGTTGQLNDFNIALNSNYANSWNHQNPYVKSWSAGNDRGSGWYIEEVTKKTYTIKIVGGDDNNYTVYNQGTPYHHGDQITGFFFSADNFSQDAAGNQPVKNTVTMEGEYLVFSFYEYDTVTGGTRPADINDYSLWYDEPATKTGVSDQWMEYALPMGNGQLGATIVGGVMTDQIQFNEKTLWEGGNTNSGSQGYYQNFGSILVKDLGSNFSIANASKPVSNYVRYLDIMDGVAGVNFSSSTGSNYTRRYFTAMGQDDKVFVARYDVDGSDKLNLLFSYAPDGQINASGVTYSYDNGVAEATFHGKLTTVQYNTRFRVLTDGTLSRTDNGIKVENGTYATLLMAAATDFDITTTTATSGESEQALASRVQSRVASAAGKSYDTLLSAHTAKQHEYMGRVDFHVGGASTMTTDALIDFYNVNANNKGTADGLFLEQLYFQYGRYMTVAANADTSIPAPSNLQGIWNDRSNSSFWHCDLHADINVEMNYWPADPTNLSEMHLPFLNHIINLSTSKAWTDYAKKVSGNNSVPGWSVACESNIFGGTSQFSNGNMKTLGAWYCTHLWRYYQYTLDKEFLKKALPVMYNAALYIKSIAQQDVAERGSLYVIKGEYSPEHEGGNLITAFAQQTSSELFDEIIKAHAELGSASPLTNDQVQEISNFYDNFNKGVQIETYSFNRDNVQYTNVPCIAEWMDKPLSDPGHRHLSHLMCVYPFSQITAYGTTQQEQDLFTAAGNAILARTGDVTGWSMGWQTNVYARVLKGNEARSYLSQALKHSTAYNIQMSGHGGCYYNLFDSHSPFQIDGNYGCTSGVAEMLLQSYDGTVHLLPALPDAWANGHINGLKAVGNFTVDQQWAEGALTKATIVNKHTAAQDLYVQYKANGETSDFDLTTVNVTVDGIKTIPVYEAGKGYKLAAVAPGAKVVINISGEEEETPVTVEYSLTPAAGTVSSNQLATVSIEFTGKDVQEGIIPFPNGMMEDQTQVMPTLTNGETVIEATAVEIRDDVYYISDITFPTGNITDGQWTLTIPQGAFYIQGEEWGEYNPVATITATYTVFSGEVIATLTINGEEIDYHKNDAEIVLNDGEANLTKVEIPNDVDNVNVTYTREFTGNNATAWQAWYVPFKYTLTSEDVNTFDFAYIWTLGVDVKTGKATNIIYEDLVEGDVLKANTPYLIKAKAATDSYEFNATGLCATKGNHIDCSTTKYQYDFVGSYESFVLGEWPYYALDNNGAFAYTSSTTYKLQPYRYFMYITEKKTNSILDPHSSSNVQKLNLIHRGENDEQTTSINAINGNDSHATTVDLTGRIVSNPRAGLFISNGKKYIVK